MKGVSKTRWVFLAIVALLAVALPLSGAFAHPNHEVAVPAVQQPDPGVTQPDPTVQQSDPAQQGYSFPNYPGYGPMMSPNYQTDYNWYNGRNSGGYGWNGWGCW